MATKTKMGRYVVLADAITVTVGRKQNGRAEYRRLLRGGLLNAPTDSDLVAKFLRVGSIKRVSSQADLDAARADLADHRRSRLRLRPERARVNSGSEEDPVVEAARDILPLTPDPDPMTAEQVEALAESGRRAVEAAGALGDE